MKIVKIVKKLTAYQSFLLHLAIKETVGTNCARIYRSHDKTCYRYKLYAMHSISYDNIKLLEKVLAYLGFNAHVETVSSPYPYGYSFRNSIVVKVFSAP